MVRRPGRVEDVRRQLDEYFEHRRRECDVAIDWSLVTPFQRKVLGATAAHPAWLTSCAIGTPRVVEIGDISLFAHGTCHALRGAS